MSVQSPHRQSVAPNGPIDSSNWQSSIEPPSSLQSMKVQDKELQQLHKNNHVDQGVQNIRGPFATRPRKLTASERESPEYIAKLNAKVLPQVDEYIEKNTSFYSNETTATICNRVKLALEKLNAEYECDCEKMKLKCLAFNTSNASLSFVIRLYAANATQSQKVVEIQRRCGCSLAFGVLYLQLTEQLKDIIDKPLVPEHQNSNCALISALQETANTNLSPNNKLSRQSSFSETRTSIPTALDPTSCDSDMLSMLCAISQTDDFAVQRETLQAISRTQLIDDDDLEDQQDEEECGTCPREHESDRICKVLAAIMKNSKNDTELVRCCAVAMRALASKCRSIRAKLLKTFSESIYTTLEAVARTKKRCLQMQATKRHIMDTIDLCLQTHRDLLAEYSHRSIAEWISVCRTCMTVTQDERLKRTFERVVKQLEQMEQKDKNDN